MASIWYGVYYTWDQNTGNTLLQDPMELFGFGLIIIAMIFVVILTNKLFKSYKETKLPATLYWALGFAFLLAAVITLIIEKFSYSALGITSVGDISAIIALITSGAAIVCFDIFSFHTTYPEHVKVLTSVVSVGAIIYLGTLVSSIIIGYPFADVMDYELVYTPIADIIVYCTLLPIILIAPIIFYYYASKIRKENKPNSTRAFWMGTGLLAFDIGYIAEVAPFFPTELSIPFRIFFAIAAYIMYVCFSMPDWFKRRIKWTD